MELEDDCSTSIWTAACSYSLHVENQNSSVKFSQKSDSSQMFLLYIDEKCMCLHK